ncbi:MAG: hypothetical protein LBR28_03575 [Bacteroidales bacterium]|jgi:hypothetical protein|nr:hypothetical protein [Bacteroidales bacterium]
MKKICLLVTGIMFSLITTAQDVNEQYPLLLGQYGINGTANYISRAGALGAVGGDITAASFNPAGLGLYLGNEITFGLGLNLVNTTAKYGENSLNNDRHNYNFGNFGLVLNLNTDNSLYKSWQFGFAFNQVKNFSNKINISREGIQNSYINNVINSLVDYASEYGLDAILYNDFINTGVVYLDSISDSTTIFVLSDFVDSGTFEQFKTIETYGYQTSMDFTFSTNIANVFYIGGAIGVPLFNYTKKESFTEKQIETGNEYTFNQITELSGSGMNFKFGIIAKPLEWLRLGASIHTPTYYLIEDNYYSSVEYNGKSGGDSPELYYSIRSPFRFIGSLALVFGNNASKYRGTLSADYEYVNYSAMKYSFDDNARFESTINNYMSNLYTSTNNLRIGGELQTGPFALRAGYAIIANPYKTEFEENDASQQLITGGLGFRGKQFYIDLAYAYTLSGNNAKYYFYDGGVTSLTHNEHLIQATIGFKF